jgi:DnaJ like chaperone protein
MIVHHVEVHDVGAGIQHGARPAEPPIEDAFRVLGITPEASDREIKTAYRRLMNQHHPDKLRARGMPESMLPVAEEKTREIRAAYERVRAVRGLR